MRKAITTLLLIIFVPILLIAVVLIGWQLLQASEERKRPLLQVAGVVTDGNGTPLGGITLRFDDQTRRHVIPLPFVGPDYWRHTESTVQSRADGRFVAFYKGDAFRLTSVESNGQQRGFASRRNASTKRDIDLLRNAGAWFINDSPDVRTNALVIVGQ